MCTLLAFVCGSSVKVRKMYPLCEKLEKSFVLKVIRWFLNGRVDAQARARAHGSVVKFHLQKKKYRLNELIIRSVCVCVLRFLCK